MSAIPDKLKYTKDHEWLRLEEDGTATIGITDYAQATLGDITFVELPAPGQKFEAGDAFGVVESVKAASDLCMPVTGEVVAVNESLADSPEWINRNPYVAAWMIRIRPRDPAACAALLDAAAYRDLVG